MVRSLGLIVLITAVTLLFVPSLFHPGKSSRFPAVDYGDYVSGFHDNTGLNAFSPSPLPTGWAANAATLTGPAAVEHLHIGFAVPGSEYAGLEESLEPVATFVPSILGTRGTVVTDRVPIAGVTWRTSTSQRGEFSLTRRADGITIVITGSATPLQLEALAGSLKPA
jgi:hypothetical protein